VSQNIYKVSRSDHDLFILVFNWLLPEEISHFSDGPEKVHLRCKLNVQISTSIYPTFRRSLDVQPTSEFDGQRANLNVLRTSI